VASSGHCLAPHDALPDGRNVVCVEGDGKICYIIDETAPLCSVVAELNGIAGHLVHNGIWMQRPGGDAQPPPRMRHAS
jgi:hypothetical protein